MPPKARRSARGATTGNQSTLSFKNKVTKPTPTSKSNTKASKPTTRLSDASKEQLVEVASPKADLEPVEVETTEAQPEPEVEPEVAIATPTPRKKKRVSAVSSNAADSREAQAEQITDAQIQRWWKQEEAERRAPRVHQSDVPTHEKILRHFDLSGQYGSCIGITRMNRWKRANKLGLEPPVEVFAVLLRESEGWGTGAAAIKSKPKAGKATSRSQGCGELAYIDELAGGRIVGVEG